MKLKLSVGDLQAIATTLRDTLIIRDSTGTVLHYKEKYREELANKINTYLHSLPVNITTEDD